jgi:GNAT superfamily N-acetyltransferase
MTQTPLLVPSPQQAEISICGETMTIIADQGVHPKARSLIWEEFFQSRKRGIDWDTHLPWAVAGEAMSVSVTAPSRATGVVDLLATLLIRRLRGTNLAMTGFVCVAPSHRGSGLSREMLDFAASTLAGLGLGEMVLWTGNSAVYESSGFTVSEQEQRITLRGADTLDDCSLGLSKWPSEDDLPGPGLAPFAIATWQATLDEARIVFADTAQGPFLLDKQGEPDAIMRAMFAARRGNWSAFVSKRNQPAFHAHVTACDYLVQSGPGPFTMRRQLGDIAAPSVYVPPAFRI